jgi:hypothetical protein
VWELCETVCGFAKTCGRVLWCAVKGKSTQPVRVRPKEVSVRLGSYPGDGRVTGPSKPRGRRPVIWAGQRAYGPQRE